MTVQPATPHNIPQWTLGDRMGKALREAGMHSKDMAEYLGLGRNTISGYITDRINPRKQTLMLWAMRTGVDLHWLTTGHTPPTQPSVTVKYSTPRLRLVG